LARPLEADDDDFLVVDFLVVDFLAADFFAMLFSPECLTQVWVISPGV
jgi:hypothetical protein